MPRRSLLCTPAALERRNDPQPPAKREQPPQLFGRYKISHLWKLPALFAAKAQLNEERAAAFSKMHLSRSVPVPPRPTGGVCDWTGGRCVEWLEREVNLPEHVPAFAKATINGGRLLYLDKPQIKALGMDDIDCEIVLARLQLLHRQDRFPRATPAPSQAR